MILRISVLGLCLAGDKLKVGWHRNYFDVKNFPKDRRGFQISRYEIVTVKKFYLILKSNPVHNLKSVLGKFCTLEFLGNAFHGDKSELNRISVAWLNQFLSNFRHPNQRTPKIRKFKRKVLILRDIYGKIRFASLSKNAKYMKVRNQSTL